MIDWNENAKAAVREFADYIGQRDKCERYLEAFVTKKTVADAVEAFSHEDLAGEWKQIRYAPKQDYFFTDINRDEWFDSVHVCTRAEFEAYVKEQEEPNFKATRENLEKIAKDAQGDFVEVREKEGEKWTHTYGSDKCYIKEAEPDFQGYIIIYSNEDGYMLVEPRELKPIKPTMTKEQHEFLCKFSADSNNLEVIAEVESYLAKHDII